MSLSCWRVQRSIPLSNTSNRTIYKGTVKVQTLISLVTVFRDYIFTRVFRDYRFFQFFINLLIIYYYLFCINCLSFKQPEIRSSSNHESDMIFSDFFRIFSELFMRANLEISHLETKKR